MSGPRALLDALLGALVHPEWAAPVAACVAAVVLVVLASFWRARRRAARLLGDPRVVGARRLVRDGALLLALAAIGAALLGPRIGTRIEWLPGSGVDVVLLVDVSRSMDAADVPPSRLARARRIARELLARLEPGDRAALAAFAGQGVLLTPLTSDLDALAELAGALDGDLLADRASDLEAGARATLAAFEAASERPRVVVVLSDGEDPSGGGDEAASALARAGVRLVAIGLGSEEGAGVPDAWRGLGSGNTLRDQRGRPVVSRRDLGRLARWAEASGGATFAGDRWGEIDVAAAVAAIRRDAGRAPGEPVARRVPAVRTVPLAALAFALLWVEWTGLLGGSVRRARRAARTSGVPIPRTARRVRVPATAAALVVLLLGAAPGEEPAPALPPDAVPRLEAALRAQPGDPQLLIALGVARAASGDREGAGHALRAAALTARDPALAALAWYDLGVLALDARELADARDAFFEALALAPDDAEARFNLEWTLRAMEAEPPPQAAGRDAEEEPRAGEESREGEPGEPSPGHPDTEDEEPGAPGTGEGSEDREPRRFAPMLSEAEVEHWLDQVPDAAGAALRAAAEPQNAARPRRPRAVPAW